METTLVTPRRFTRKPLPATGKLAVLGLIGLASAFIYLQAILIGMLIPPLAIFAVISLVVAGIVALGWHWAPLLGALWSAFLVVGNTREIGYSLSHPAELRGFVFIVFMLAMASIGLVAGIAAVVQNRRGQRAAPRTLAAALTGLAGVCLGAVLVAAVAAGGVNAGVSPETLSALPALTTANFAFDQPELRVKVGETVALRLENADSEGHSFDIDELNVHALIPTGESSLALFKPTKAGTYTFYCAPHYDKASGEGMHGILIVEP